MQHHAKRDSVHKKTWAIGAYLYFRASIVMNTHERSFASAEEQARDKVVALLRKK